MIMGGPLLLIKFLNFGPGLEHKHFDDMNTEIVSTVDCLIPFLYFGRRYKNKYQSKTFWCDCRMLVNNNYYRQKNFRAKYWVWLLIFGDYMLTYGVMNIIGGIHYTTMIDDEIGDLRINMYDYWIVVLLLMSKIILQIIYASGDEYDAYDEARTKEHWTTMKTQDEIFEMLCMTFGDDLSWIIFEFVVDCEEYINWKENVRYRFKYLVVRCSQKTYKQINDDDEEQ